MYKPIMHAFITVLFFVSGMAAAADNASPVAVIEQAEQELAQKLEGRKDELRNDKQALYKLIDSILLPRFDRDYSAQLVLGRYWRSADKDQRKRFVDAFYRTLLQKYADGVLDFDQSRIQILPYRGDASDKRTSVGMMVTLDDGTKVPVNYALVKRDSGWMVFDVTIEGISYVRNFRAEMNSEVGTKGLDAVIKRLETEAASKESR